MVPADLQPFLAASVAASSALIGLLFVSVSIAPERTFGAESDPRKQAQAVSAFSALANVFFISMSSLIPGIGLGVVVTIVGTVSSLQLVGLLVRVRSLRADPITAIRGLILFAVSGFVYGTEIYLGVVLWNHPASNPAQIGLLEVMLGAYGIGLGRAWQLLGAPRLGFVSYLLDFLERRWPPRRSV